MFFEQEFKLDLFWRHLLSFTERNFAFPHSMHENLGCWEERDFFSEHERPL